MITLSYGGTTLDLPEALMWPDEFSWTPIVQDVQYTITGAMIVQAAKKQAGQPITLVGSLETTWLSRLTVKTIKSWAEEAGRIMVLNLRGVDRNVIFDHSNGPIETGDVWDYADPDDTDNLFITLRFLTV